MKHGQLHEYLTRKDFVSSSEVRWCPGCGDYAILSAIQTALPQTGIPKEDFVFVSGIGCSSRFPYYMDTYGFHSIHGRAPAIATGVKVAHPHLSVWVITGDGDGLSIGGNHLIHALRRNLDLNIILFNNRIYGLTKGQYSPTTEKGFITKTSPYGVIDQPINPLSIALASEATFIARSIDTNPQHLASVMKASCEHKGASFVETFQNCVIFNKGTWSEVSDRSVREDRLLFLEHGKPLLFGRNKNKGIQLKDGKFMVVTLGEHGVTLKDIFVHDMHSEDPVYPFMLANMNYPEYPVPVGIIRCVDRPTYEEELEEEISRATALKGRRNMQALLRGSEFWTVSDSGNTIKTSGGTADKYGEEAAIISERMRESVKDTDPLTASLKTPIGKIFYDYDYKRSKSMSPRDSITKAIAYFKANKIECIIVAQNNRIYGLLTERDIIQNVVLSNVDRDRTPISTIMRPVYDIMEEENTIADAINILSISGHRHVPLHLKDGNYGLATIRQILQFICHQRDLIDENGENGDVKKAVPQKAPAKKAPAKKAPAKKAPAKKAPAKKTTTGATKSKGTSSTRKKGTSK